VSSEAKTLNENNAEELAAWCGGRSVVEHDALDDSKTSPGINVPVGQDVQRASLGDTIIRKHDGTFEIFRNTN
jgi:hypothetical protein